MDSIQRKELITRIRRDNDGLIIDPITFEEIDESKVYILNYSDSYVNFTSVDTLYKNLVLSNNTTNPFNREELDDLPEIYDLGRARRTIVTVYDSSRNYNSQYRETVFIADFFRPLSFVAQKVIELSNNLDNKFRFDILLNDGLSFYDCLPDTEISVLAEGKTLNLTLIKAEFDKDTLEKVKAFFNLHDVNLSAYRDTDSINLSILRNFNLDQGRRFYRSNTRGLIDHTSLYPTSAIDLNNERENTVYHYVSDSEDDSENIPQLEDTSEEDVSGNETIVLNISSISTGVAINALFGMMLSEQSFDVD